MKETKIKEEVSLFVPEPICKKCKKEVKEGDPLCYECMLCDKCSPDCFLEDTWVCDWCGAERRECDDYEVFDTVAYCSKKCVEKYRASL